MSFMFTVYSFPLRKAATKPRDRVIHVHWSLRQTFKWTAGFGRHVLYFDEV